MNILVKGQHLHSFNRQVIAAKLLSRAIICESCSASRYHGNLLYPATGSTRRKYGNDCTGGDVSHFFREVKAFSRILQRSGILHPRQVQQLLSEGKRYFSTSPVKWQQPPGDDKDPSQKGPEDEGQVPPFSGLVTLTMAFFLTYIVLRSLTSEQEHFISWNEFQHDMLSKGEVEKIVINPDQEKAFIYLYPGAIIHGQPVRVRMFTLKFADSQNFESKVRQAEEELGIKPNEGVNITYRRISPWEVSLFMIIVLGALFLLLRSIKPQGMASTDMFAGARKANFIRADLQSQQGQGISFKDVAGLHEAKVEIMEFVDYIRRPERFKDLGGKAPKGALLLGPPGCGKTLLAKALANEAKVPFLAMAGSEFVEMLGGLGAARVRDLFKEAREKAPCIIYIDEIDAIGRKRSGDNWDQNAEEEHTLNQLLVEMDGMSTTSGVIMLASTNRADVLDKALLRPGRFDRHIMIDYPTLSERKEMFNMYLRQLKLAKIPETYVDHLAQLTPGMTGADIANVCNEAALHAARLKKSFVDAEDFDYSVERVIAGVAKKSSVLSAHEKKVIAYHEAGHALVGWLLEYTDPLLRVSIVPRTSHALGFAQYLPSDKKLHSKEELFERICMALGGRVAESLTFNRVTSGAQDDLKQVTKIAYALIREYGMNDVVGQVSFPPEGNDMFAVRPYSKYLARIIDEESRRLVAKAYKATEKLLQENQEKLRMIAEGLLEKEVLTYKDMEQLIGPPTYDKACISGFS